MSEADSLSSQEKLLIEKAVEVRERAYALYSNFMVGAALLALDGSIHVGCNVENASYGLSVCAERNALAAAIAAGHDKFSAIAIVTGGDSPASPCGACRQVLAEFGQDMTILLATPEGQNVQRLRLVDLLPWQFTL